MVELSPRQQQIAGLVAEGLTVREIADRLGVSYHTIRNHKAIIYARTGVRNAVELTRLLAEAA